MDVDDWEHPGGVSYAHGALTDGRRIIFEQRLGRTSTDAGHIRLAIDPARAFLFNADERRLRIADGA